MFHTYVTLVQTVYRALLTSAVSGIGHRIHTPKKTFAEWRQTEEGEQEISSQITKVYNKHKYMPYFKQRLTHPTVEMHLKSSVRCHGSQDRTELFRCIFIVGCVSLCLK